MSYQSRSQKKSASFILIAALALLVLGFPLFANFEQAQRLFLRLSPDKSFEPLTLLILRSSFLSSGLVGICLLLFLLWGRNLLKNGLTKLEGLKESDFLLWFLGLALFLRIAWVTCIPTQLYADWKWYDEVAYHMSRIWRYEENGVPTAYWPIGYPLFLAIIYRLFGHHYWVVQLFNVFLSSGICVFTYLVAKRLLSPASSRLTLVILALFPSQIFFTNILASEILFTFLLLLVIYFLHKQMNRPSIYSPLIIGILLGVLILIRAVALLLPLVIMFFYFKSKRRPRLILKDTALTFLMIFLMLFPWVLRNKLVLGTFTVATSGGINLYIGNSPISSGSWVWRKENPFRDLSAPNEVENDRLGYKLATKYIMDDPGGFIWRGVKKEIYLFATDFSAIARELDLAAQFKRVDKFVIFNIIGQV